MIENGVPKLISEHKELKGNRVVDIFIKDSNLLFITQKRELLFIAKTLPKLIKR